MPLPGVVTIVAFCWIVVHKHRSWKRLLVPEAIQDLGDRCCAVEGRLRKLDEELVSPYTGKACLAWCGWFASRGDALYEAFARAVPFVIELSSGGACVVRMVEIDWGGHRWQHLGYAEETVCASSEPPFDDEGLARARDFFGEICKRQHYFPQNRPIRELAYADGDLVVLAGRFRRVEGTPNYRGVESLPVYEVDGDVVLAKGAAVLHRKLLSPWLRARWSFYLMLAGLLELAVDTAALIVSALVFIGQR